MDDGINISSEEPQLPISGVKTPESSKPAPDFAVQPSYVRTVFWGPDGLRAGWGFAFYVTMFYVLQYFVLRSAAAVELGANGLWSMMLEEFGLLCAAVVPALLLGSVERRAWGGYGLPGRAAFGKLFWVGTAWGFAGMTLLMALMYGLRVFDVGHLAMHGMRVVRFAVFWAVFFCWWDSLRSSCCADIRNLR
ncbi:MAG: hypothetical protein WBX10_18360 [Candidatus Sulfotelmatobacter sp.]